MIELIANDPDVSSKTSFIPLCEDDGTYVSKQCNLTEFCWCVDKQTGIEIAGTLTPPERKDGLQCGGKH